MSTREQAIQYCSSIGVDPHADVWGYFEGEWTVAERWAWYVPSNFNRGPA